MKKKVYVFGDVITSKSSIPMINLNSLWWKQVWKHNPEYKIFNFTETNNSNDSILRSISQRVYREVDYVLVMWANTNRFEFLFDDYIDTSSYSQWSNVKMGKKYDNNDEMQKFSDIFNNFVGKNKGYQLYNSWKNIYLAQCILNELGIEYVFTHASKELFSSHNYGNIVFMSSVDMTRWYFPDTTNRNGLLDFANNASAKTNMDNAYIKFGEGLKKQFVL